MLRRHDHARQLNCFIAVARFTGGTHQLNRGGDADTRELHARCRERRRVPRGGTFNAHDRVRPIFAGGSQTARRERWVARLECAIRHRFGGRRDVIRIGVVLGFHRFVVRVADDVVRPVVVAAKPNAIAAGKSDAQYPREPPRCFFDEPGNKRRLGASVRELFGKGKHRVRPFTGIDEPLREVARVVPTAAHGDALAAERRKPVQMIDAVDTGHVKAAPVAVVEVECLPDR